VASANKRSTSAKSGGGGEFLEQLERATRGLLALNVSVLEQLEKRIGLTPLRALQSLERLGPSLVTELGDDLNLLSSTASRLSDRLAEAGYITRRVSPTNRRATLLELTDDGQAVLDELVVLRVRAFGEVTEQMTAADRSALVRGTQAFTAIQQQAADHARRRRGDGAGDRNGH
jgi:DNA-binding MarR family transcriptional regulator